MKKNLILMYCIAFLQGMVFYGPIATLYRQAQGLSVFDITLIESLCLALSVLLEIPWGVLADRLGYRRTMIICCGLYFVSKIIFWQADGFADFLVERVLLSVVIAGMSGVDTTILYLSGRPENSQRVFGMYDAMGMAGLVLATLIFSIWVQDNYRLAAFLTMISYGLAGLCALGLKEVHPVKQSSISQSSFGQVIKEVVGNKKLLLLLLAMALLSETHQTITTFLNQPKYLECGLGESMIGWVYLVSTGLGIAGALSVIVTRHLKKLGTVIILGGSYVIACWLLTLTDKATVAIFGILLLRLAHTFFQPYLRQCENAMIQTSQRATALSVNAMGMDGVAIMTNLIFGAFAKVNLSIAFLFGAMISLLSVVLLSYLAFSKK